MATWTIKPGIAALVRVIAPDGVERSAIFLNREKGVVIGLHDRRMKDSDLPIEVQTAINLHFNHVFSLEHETWAYPNREPSPRSVYCDNLQSWTIEVPE